MFTELFKIFNQITKLEPKDEQILREIFSLKDLKKNEYFIREGEWNNKAAFILSGLVRYYVIKNDEESTLEFTEELQFIADFPSFAERGKSKQYIQAVEDCQLLVADYDGVQRIYNEVKDGNLIGRRIIEQRFIVMMNQLQSIYMHNPEQRYSHFVENYTDIAQRIPQYLIASYVGIKPQSLSRIRNRMTRK